MANKTSGATNPVTKKYVRTGIIAAAVVAVGIIGIYAVSHMRGGANLDTALESVSTDAASAADLRVAVVRMDAIQTNANALKDLRKQKESYETKLREELTREQKALEKEKTEIEKSQDVLSRDALQRRVVDYQNRVARLQQTLAERAQSIDTSFQKALADVQAKHLDPIIEGVIAKKKLSLVIDGRFARVGAAAENLDITDQVIDALNKKVSSVKMETPKGF
ncbi:OmpH family outer membrane protein [bacterium]|nr:OmpH family outer membrane protein [bacterium]